MAEEITGDVESRRAKLSDKQHTVKRERTGGKAEIISCFNLFLKFAPPNASLEYLLKHFFLEREFSNKKSQKSSVFLKFKRN